MLPKINNRIIVVALCIVIIVFVSISAYRQSIEGATDYSSKFDEDADELALKNKPADQPAASDPETADTPPANMSDPMNLPLREFFIMASYDSTFNGSSPSVETLADVMYSGCRFIDLNVFMGAKEKRLFVGPTKDIDATSADLSLKLSEVLAYINEYAFVVDNKAKARGETPLNERNIPGINKPAEGAPTLGGNYTKYPLFLNFRIQQASPETDIISTLYTDYLAGDKGLISSKFRLMSGEEATQINGNTPLRELAGKIVISIDIDNVLKNYTPTTMNAMGVKQPVKDAIRKFVNVKTGGHTWHTYHSYNTIESLQKTSISPKGGDLTTDVQKMYLAYPGSKDSSKNPNALLYLSEHGIQTTLMHFYVKDGHLDDYKKTFRESKSPMVPINTVLRKVDVMK
jgi:hypothetical protein